MKILFIKSHTHHKNFNFILKCKNIKFTIIQSASEICNFDLSIFDCVYSPCEPIDVLKYPNTKFIFGPHFSIFPDNKLQIIKGQNNVYNLLSEWVANLWKPYCQCENLKIITLPFGVDTEKFFNNKPQNERNDVILYFKHRNPHELHIVESFLQNRKIQYVIFSYDMRYDENEYIKRLQQSKYCIWIDGHESQGFGLQEALSCDVPILVWNVKSMNQEYGQNYDDIPATTIPYWDYRCGEFFYNENELENMFELFLSKLETYNPRNFIIENLSVDICEKKLMDVVINI